MPIAKFLNQIEEDQGTIGGLDNNQIVEMVLLPEEEEPEELVEETPQVSSAVKNGYNY
ncbi:hypothetical protein K3495_g2406 [Podosphaera aphanis]|nr:hypothetical protein K3495_g2406 [Podosphaera aphanis]